MYRSYGDREPGNKHIFLYSVIALIVLLVAIIVFANTAAGQALLQKVGIGDDKAAQIAPTATTSQAALAQPSATTTPTASPTTESTVAPTLSSVTAQESTATVPGATATSPKNSTGATTAVVVPAAKTVQPTNTKAHKKPKPTRKPTATPTRKPKSTPTRKPKATPTHKPTATRKPTPTPTKTPTPKPLPSTSPLKPAQRFLVAWEHGKYNDMYDLLSKDSRKKYKRDYFLKRYKGITDAATITSIDTRFTPAAKKAAKEKQPTVKLMFLVKMKTQMVGEINQRNVLPLVAEGKHWRVEWSPSLIFNQLSGDEHIYMLRIPAPRGTIYDHSGTPLAMEGVVPQIGIVPAHMKNESKTVKKLSKALGYSQKYIRNLYKGKPSGWYFPIKSLSQDEYNKLKKELGNISGVVFQTHEGRIYPQGKILGQVLGYVGPITAEDLKKPEYEDYPSNAIIGRTGLEHWGEKYLRGEDGGKLEVLSKDYTSVVSVIKQKSPVPGDNIYLNIDLKLQQAAEKDFGDKLTGSVVILDPNNGRILALVSHPSYDPNVFVRGISQKQYNKLNKEHAFINRSINAAYPMASTFKPITMAAGLTSGLFKPTSMFYDPGHWNKDGGPMRTDWLPGDEGHGYLNLNKGLVVSCDVVFYEVGFKLYQRKYDYLSRYARKWGLGQSPGVDGLLNESGLVPGPGSPNPGWGPGDNVNLAIGQGALQISPLQNAMVYMAIANGGTLYRPHLINHIEKGGTNKVLKRYRPEVIRKLPVSKANLNQIRNDLKKVTHADYGTANFIFKGFPISVAGKTGTGQADEKEPYAWFSSYAPTSKPKVVVVAMAENAGEGSEVAAPIVKKVLADYFHVKKK